MIRHLIVIGDTAKQQIREAVTWWRRERTKAPSALSEDIRGAYRLLMQHPMVGRPIDDPEFREIRRLSLNRTHYFLFYEVVGTTIRIVGLRHQSRQAIPGEGRSSVAGG